MRPAILRYVAISALSIAVAAALPLAAWGQNLTIGTSTEISSVDPHYHVLSPNISAARHIYEALINSDEKQELKPALATSWKAVTPTKWEFKLRKGVKFHDGSEFTSKDVLYTLERVPKVPNSPGLFSVYTRFITKAEAPDAHTVIFHTATPYPLLPNDLAQVFIISAKSEGKTTEDFNAGRAAIGTGPYQFVEWVRGDRLVLKRNPTYW